MNRQELVQQIKEKQSFLCVGLDTDIKKIPQHLLNTLTVIEMKQGWQDSLYAQVIKRPGMTNSQVKLLLIAKEPADKKWYYHEA